MNEEGIIELVEELKENCQCWLEDEDTCADDRKWFEKEKIVLQNLLDLYNQEKEKNKKLEDCIDLLIKGFIELKDNDEIFCTVPDDFCNPNECIKVTDCTDCIRGYYFNKAKEKANDK